MKKLLLLIVVMLLCALPVLAEVQVFCAGEAGVFLLGCFAMAIQQLATSLGIELKRFFVACMLVFQDFRSKADKVSEKSE